MRLNLLSYAGGLGLVAGALMWPGVSHAQGFCYLINSEGEVVNLDDMCQDSNDPETSPTPEASNTSDESQGTSSSSEVRSTTITSPAGTSSTGASPAVTSPTRTNPDETPNSNEDTNPANPNNENTNQAAPNTGDSGDSPATTESPQAPASENTSDTPDDGNDATDTGPENRLDIPVREIETPDIPVIQTPQRLDSTENDTDTSQ
ncbi:hypothetical protein [Phormidium tenue]|nr:hypothetical protein [Phormidium tenue]MBD2234812.1 hypothetical protein [Phormidium tenue FACHB-1052]